MFSVTSGVDKESKNVLLFIYSFYLIYECKMNWNWIENTPSLCYILLGLQFGQLGHCVGHVRQDMLLPFSVIGICCGSSLGIVAAVDLNSKNQKYWKIKPRNYCSNDTQI